MAKLSSSAITPEDAPPKFFAQHLKPYEFLSASIENKTVLEIGCGDGYGALYLSGRAARVVAVDRSEENIQHAKNRYKKENLAFQVMDAARLTFPDGSFDAVCSFQVIEHIREEELTRYLREIKRVLKNSGELYLTTLNLEHNMKEPASYKKNADHHKEFRLEELEGLLSSVFSDVRISGLRLTARHAFYQRLKKTGICKFLPAAINPVDRFYHNVTPDDFRITADNLRQSIDFICICKK